MLNGTDGTTLFPTATSTSSHPLASGSNTAAQPQMQERRLFVLAGSARSQQTPAEGREITDRLLTIGSDQRQLANTANGQTTAFTKSDSGRAGTAARAA